MKFQAEAEQEKKTHILGSIFSFIIVIALLLFGYAKFIGIKGLIVKEYSVESTILTENFNGIKIVHFSDLLYGTTVNFDDVKKMVEKVNTLKPDIIVFTGDLVKSGYNLPTEKRAQLTDFLNQMEAPIGKYAIKGNADYSNEKYDEIMYDSGFKVINNSYEKVYYNTLAPLYIVGLPSKQKDTVDLDKAFEFYNELDRIYTIVLVHEGNTITYLDESDYEVDLILGGHSFGGSVVVPYYGPLFIDKESSKYYADAYTKGITNIYISSGLGTNEYPYRIFNKPSINLYRLKTQAQ